MNGKRTFVEVCVYEVKPSNEEEFEKLMEEVGKIRRKQKGYVHHTLLKRRYRQGSFKDVKAGKPPIELSRRFKDKPTTYILYWECSDKESHATATSRILKTHYKKFPRLLKTAPKIILCDNLGI